MNGYVSSVTIMPMVCPSGSIQKSKEDSSVAGKSSGNVVRTDTYAHPQHIKVVKHIICD